MDIERVQGERERWIKKLEREREMDIERARWRERARDCRVGTN